MLLTVIFLIIRRLNKDYYRLTDSQSITGLLFI